MHIKEHIEADGRDVTVQFTFIDKGCVHNLVTPEQLQNTSLSTWIYMLDLVITSKKLQIEAAHEKRTKTRCA